MFWYNSFSMLSLYFGRFSLEHSLCMSCIHTVLLCLFYKHSLGKVLLSSRCMFSCHQVCSAVYIFHLDFIWDWDMIQMTIDSRHFCNKKLLWKLQLIQVQINLLNWSLSWDMIILLCCKFAWMSVNGTRVAWLHHHIMQSRLWPSSVTWHALYVYLLTQLFGMTCQIKDTKTCRTVTLIKTISIICAY